MSEMTPRKGATRAQNWLCFHQTVFIDPTVFAGLLPKYPASQQRNFETMASGQGLCCENSRLGASGRISARAFRQTGIFSFENHRKQAVMAVFFLFAGLFGLVIGSFLNVVIHRGPVLWGLAPPAGSDLEDEAAWDYDRNYRGTLVGPRSACPSCGRPIRSWHNLPVISFIWLRGRCADCGSRIAWRYPLVELGGAAIALFALWAAGPFWPALGIAVFGWTLLALAAIDLETGFLPDRLTLPLIVLGLAINLAEVYTMPFLAVAGALFGYGVFWLTAITYRLLKKQEGLGLGDAKLLAAIGAWAGLAWIAPAILLASVVALAGVAFSLLFGRKVHGKTEIRFGPALALAGFVVLLVSVRLERVGTLPFLQAPAVF